ncbi:ornithine decarboxylase antizyme 1-like [Daphnia carinata]|uniref:ornithine decarboxylase antizyme 1-like n=1 Tax=Daphnia carinata TaxID=120202 RepID=UPI00257E5C16|nr:ornithine decarboxylase antizyme 1-like [Daphnia carinata]
MAVDRWGWGLGGGPDVPHAANSQHQQVGSTPPEGHSSHGGVGNNHNNKQLSVSSQEVIQQQQIGEELVKASRQQPTRLAFVLELTATRDWRWEGVLWRGRLYLEVPSRLVQTGSKEGFVALLEYAEEELQCSHVVLALSKERADRADVIRTFMFLGFSVLPPGHQLVPANSNNLFLACSLE